MLMASLKSKTVNIKSTKKELRKFGIIVGFLLLLTSALFFKLQKPGNAYYLTIGLLLIISAIFYPMILKVFYKIWMTFSNVFGWIMTRVILFLFYFIIFTPIAIILRIFGERFLDLNINKECNTYWNDKLKDRKNTTDLKKQF